MRWPLQPLQSFQQTQLQPPFGQSVDSLCHPWFTTTTNVSYRFPILKLPPPPCAVLLVYTCLNLCICIKRYSNITILFSSYTSSFCIQNVVNTREMKDSRSGSRGPYHWGGLRDPGPSSCIMYIYNYIYINIYIYVCVAVVSEEALPEPSPGPEGPAASSALRGWKLVNPSGDVFQADQTSPKTRRDPALLGLAEWLPQRPGTKANWLRGSDPKDWKELAKTCETLFSRVF